MPVRVVVNRAGTGAGNNLIRSLRAARRSVYVIGCHHDPFVLRKSSADTSCLLPRAEHTRYTEALCSVISTERADLFLPHTDDDVHFASRLRDTLPCRVFLPPHDVVELCQDKYRLNAFLGDRGVPVPLTYPVTSRSPLEEVFARLAPRSPLWCRVRSGSGSVGATPVRTVEQARAWISYWEDMRGIRPGSFVLSEYLPGRDFACQMLWRAGTPVLTKTCERLSYFGGAGRPSGVSSVAALAKTVYEPRVRDICMAAIRALGPEVSGAFSLDLKEDASGVPRITEINAGRFITMMNLFDLTGKRSMTATYLALALEEPVDLGHDYDIDEDHYFMRDVDTVPAIFHADDLFAGIADARQPATEQATTLSREEPR
jgi:carbamoyl-phosphate synthase large subunit